jgi:NitT/TauT family transport system substrate-binding protein
MPAHSINRRSFLRSSAFVAGAAAAMPFISACGSGGSAAGNNLSLQGGWLLSEGQLGEAVALAKGYYDDEGLGFTFRPGGPSVDGVSLVAAGQSQIGQISSSPSLMLASSQHVPVRAFAVGVQRQPYAYISKPGKPVREPKDLIGKTVGTQSTGSILLTALLKVNDIDPKDVKVKIIGADITPLTTGQVDVWTGWLTNVAAMRPLDGRFEAMTLWDAGVELYGYPYYANEKTFTNNPKLLEKFVRATAKGWAFAASDIETAAQDVAKMDKTGATKAADIQAAGKVLLPYAFNDVTASDGWGAMTDSTWQKQIDLYAGLDQFKTGAPKLSDVVDMSILKATASDRPKVG